MVVAHRIFHEPLPGQPASALIGRAVAETQASELLEKPDVRNHMRGVFLAYNVGPREDPEGPGRMRQVAGADVSGKSVCACQGGVAVLCLTCQLVEFQVSDAEFADLV